MSETGALKVVYDSESVRRIMEPQHEECCPRCSRDEEVVGNMSGSRHCVGRSSELGILSKRIYLLN
jgi:hypothetical protein